MVLDLASKKYKHLKWLRNKLFGKMLRPHEKESMYTFNGATWVFIAASLTFLLFPKIIAVTAFSILIISDVSAALIGRKFGRITIFEHKSVEGTAAFIVSASILVMLYGLLFGAPSSFYYVGFVAAFIGGIVEAASKKLRIDDNLTIPLSIGGIMWVGAKIAENAGESFLNIEVQEKVRVVVDSLRTIDFK
jgi:dolichol kinase